MGREAWKESMSSKPGLTWICQWWGVWIGGVNLSGSYFLDAWTTGSLPGLWRIHRWEKWNRFRIFLFYICKISTWVLFQEALLFFSRYPLCCILLVNQLVQSVLLLDTACCLSWHDSCLLINQSRHTFWGWSPLVSNWWKSAMQEYSIDRWLRGTSPPPAKCWQCITVLSNVI